MMDGDKYSDSDLQIMSYQDLRRLSTSLRLPANIEKKHMISMIRAHQDGDIVKKAVINKQVQEERKTKRMIGITKRGKSSLRASAATIQQVPTDLSLSAKNNFGTRYSFVSNNTTNTATTATADIKEADKSNGYSRIFIEHFGNEGDSSVISHTSRRLTPMGRTEIMLPRNHSLTTPVQLVPQNDRTFFHHQPTRSQGAITETDWSRFPFEAVSPPTSAQPYRQEVATRFDSLPISAELVTIFANNTTPQNIYQSQSYWRERPKETTPFLPIMSTFPSSSCETFSSSTPSLDSSYVRSSTFQQSMFEKYVRSGQMDRNETIKSVNAYVTSYEELTDEMVPYFGFRSPEKKEEGLLARRQSSVIRHTNSAEVEKSSDTCLVDIYLTERRREPESEVNDFRRGRTAAEQIEAEDGENGNGYLANYNTCLVPSVSGIGKTAICLQERDPGWCLTESSNRGEIECDDERTRSVCSNALVAVKTPGRSLNYPSEAGNSYLVNILEDDDAGFENSDSSVVLPRKASSEDGTLNKSCRFYHGHDHDPVNSDESRPLPSFMTTFAPSMKVFNSYSVCKDSYTGTTYVHSNPVMASGHSSEYRTYYGNSLRISSDVNPNGAVNLHHSSSDVLPINNEEIVRGRHFSRAGWLYGQEELDEGESADEPYTMDITICPDIWYQNETNQIYN